MKIKTRLILTLIVMSLIPIAVVGFVGLQVIDASTSLTLDRSVQALKDLGEASIRQQASDVAHQVELYLQAHPELTELSPEKLRGEPTLTAIAVQPIGKTGYTAVYDSNGVTQFHINPAMVGKDMHTLAETLPDYWRIFGASLDGTSTAGYYKWQDADGKIRDKYMVCVPIGHTRLRVAATTYIDEFYQPIRETQTRVSAIVSNTHNQLYLALLLMTGLALGAATFLVRSTIHPLKRIAEAAERFGHGQLNREIPITSRDEIGQLAASFNRMVRELSKAMEEKDSAAHQLQGLNQHLEQTVETRMNELRQARDEALNTQKMLETVLDTVPVRLFWKDRNLRYLGANHLFAQDAGLESGMDLIGRDDYELAWKDQAELYRADDWSVIESGVPKLDIEEPQTTPTGDTIWLQTSKIPLRNPQGELIGVMGTYADVTSRKRAEAEREQLIKDLQVAKRLAEENARLKSEFLSTMSHELRTPLNAIEGFTGIILNHIGGTDFNNKTEGYLTRIRSNSKRLLQLINDFLDLSRVESGRLELANQPFSPETLAKRWQDEISVLAEKKGLEFEVKLDDTLPDTLYGDEEAISKVAINLLGNAIKFTEQGQIKLGIERINGTWNITVADTGIGIPPHARDFIFEEFRQVDQTSKRKYGGTGLGLAIVQKYTRAMGGTISVKSELGKGSTFTVSLPLKTTSNMQGDVHHD